jgi:putative acetyltransferase
VVLVRRLVPDDAEALVLLNVECAADYGRLAPEPEEVLTDVDVQRSMLEDEDESRPGLLLGGFVDGALAGTATLFSTGLAKTRHVAELGLAVRPSFRRLGVGRALLEAVIEDARCRSRLRKIVGRVFADNEPALALYRSLGFVTEGLQRGQYLFRDGTARDSLWLALFLDGGA